MQARPLLSYASLSAGMGVCRTSNYSQYVTFDGTHHTFRGTYTYVLVKVCHSTMDLPFFKISGKHRKQKGQSDASYLYQVNVDIFNTRVTLKSDKRVLVSWVVEGRVTCVSLIYRGGQGR